MQKTYLSRAVTRAMSADHPVGDPTGGPAYGEKRDPISAVIAIGSMAGEYAAAAAVAGAGAGAGAVFSAMTLTQGVVFAGAALNLVGNVTGNKTIQKLGMVVGIAGGITQLGNKLFEGSIGNTTLGEAFGSSPMPLDEASLISPPRALQGTPSAIASAPLAEIAPPDALAQVSPVGGPGNLNASVLDANGFPPPASAPGGPPGPVVAAPPAPGVPQPGSTNYRLAEASNVSSPLAPAAPAPAVAAPAAPAVGAPDAANPAGGLRSSSFGPAGLSNIPAAPSAIETQVAGMAAQKPAGIIDMAKAGNYSGAISQVGANAMDMLKNNPTGAYVAAQAVGAAANYLSGKTEAELNALKARTGYENAAALKIQAEIDREKQRRVNLNAGYGQVNTAMSTNPGVTMNGLIANARPAA